MRAKGLPSMSHEAICRHVWLDKAKEGSLHRFLRHSPRKRRKQYGKRDFRGRILCRTDISERPPWWGNAPARGIGRHTVIGKGRRGRW